MFPKLARVAKGKIPSFSGYLLIPPMCFEKMVLLWGHVGNDRVAKANVSMEKLTLTASVCSRDFMCRFRVVSLVQGSLVRIKGTCTVERAVCHSLNR